MARILEAQGDLDGALDLLDEAERLYVSDFYPNVRPVAALKAWVWVAQGRLGEASTERASRACLPMTTSATCASSGQEHPGQGALGPIPVRWGRTLHSRSDATAGAPPPSGGRRQTEGSVIESLTLQVLAHEAQGDIPSALVPLERALALAEPEGYVRIFVDEGRPMAQLLSEAAVQGIMPDYTAKLLAVFEAEEHKSEGEPYLSPAAPARSLTEPLSQRELEVLRLISQGFSNREIGERLCRPPTPPR
jgi:LuxR family maltose regulon positive regulatory protein